MECTIVVFKAFACLVLLFYWEAGIQACCKTIVIFVSRATAHLTLQNICNFSVVGVSKDSRCHTSQEAPKFVLRTFIHGHKGSCTWAYDGHPPPFCFSMVLIVKELLTNITDFKTVIHIANMGVHSHSFLEMELI